MVNDEIEGEIKRYFETKDTETESMEYRKSSPKRKVHSDIGLPPENNKNLK